MNITSSEYNTPTQWRMRVFSKLLSSFHYIGQNYNIHWLTIRRGFDEGFFFLLFWLDNAKTKST